MDLKGVIDELVIDDIMTLLRFYHDYRKNPQSSLSQEGKNNSYEDRNKDIGFIFHFDKKKYMFYSKNVKDGLIPLLSIMTYDRNKLNKFGETKERLMEKIGMGTEEALRKVLGILSERIRDLREGVY